MGISVGHNALYTKHLGDKYSYVILFFSLAEGKAETGQKGRGARKYKSICDFNICALGGCVCWGIISNLDSCSVSMRGGEMLSPQGGEEKLGSQILLLIDTWVNIILAEGEGKKKINAGIFITFQGQTGGEIKDTVL